MSLTNLLVLVNVVAFVWELATGGPDYDHGYLIGAAVVEHGQWWRVFSSAFLHGSIPHVALNMIALYQVGNLVEQLFGKLRFALLYTLAIVGSGLTVIWFNYDQPTLGASGAIFGLFGALVAVGLRLGRRGRALIGQVVPIVVLNLIFTFAVPGISAAAHVGGLITGFVVGFVLFMMPSRQRERVYAYAFAPPPDPAGVVTIDQEPEPPRERDETAPAEPPRPGPNA
ncbi:MAG TPA: rhomboid family intramembrane serine protease [Candidatus Limnocylindria bacterium]|nr:rhomboid family intramembrane serine protease [Candidatus Limnocylindria bacterium]